MSKTSKFGVSAREGHDASDFYNRKVYADGAPAGSDSAAENELREVDVIHRGDSRRMTRLPDRSVHLMITSPPYNVGKEYDEDLSLDEYKDLLAGVMAETYRVLVGGGRACVNIANIGRTPYIPLHAHIVEIARECGFLMRGEIIWDKGSSAGASCAWGSWRSASNPVLRDLHEYILVFSKGDFKRVSKKESAISRDDFLECTKSVWRFPAASARRARHPAPFPIELPLRLINLYSFVGDIVLDPFMGSGTTALAAAQVGRRYVGYEIDAGYVSIANERLNAAARDLSLFK